LYSRDYTPAKRESAATTTCTLHGKAKILADPGAGKAIGPAQLIDVGRRHLPVVVVNASLAKGTTVAILWQVNAQAGGGFVIELSNEHGVAKDPCGTMTLQSAGAVTVVLEVLKAAGHATEWVSGDVVAARPVAVGSRMAVVPPGNTSFIEFGAPYQTSVHKKN
jgi:hypothetical protein